VATVRTKYALFGIFGVTSLILDQITKVWARGALGPEFSGTVQQVIEGKLYFRFALNRGVAFSMFRDLAGGRWILTIVAFAAFFLVLHYLRKTEVGQTRLHVALGLVGGGALGNLADRIIYGAVTDFVIVDLDVWPLDPWPAFNVADAALVVGVGLMALDMFRKQPADDASPRPVEDAGAAPSKRA
jgi:signal peptidase II